MERNSSRTWLVAAAVVGICVLGLTGCAPIQGLVGAELYQNSAPETVALATQSPKGEVALSTAVGHSTMECTGRITGGSVSFTKTTTSVVARVSVKSLGYWIKSLTADNATYCYELELWRTGTSQAVYKTQVWKTPRVVASTKVLELWKVKAEDAFNYTLNYKTKTSGSYYVKVRIIHRNRWGGASFSTDWSKCASVKL
jgi:hypothetical protein